MSLKDCDVGRIAERLAIDFDGQVPIDILIKVLRLCNQKDVTASPDRVEQAARIRLQIWRQGAER